MTNDPINIDKKILSLFEKIDLELCEYEKKQLCIILLASTTNHKSCQDVSKTINVMAHSMNKEWIEAGYSNQLDNG